MHELRSAEWRKSSRSGEEGGQCVEITVVDDALLKGH